MSLSDSEPACSTWFAAGPSIKVWKSKEERPLSYAHNSEFSY